MPDAVVAVKVGRSPGLMLLGLIGGRVRDVQRGVPVI